MLYEKLKELDDVLFVDELIHGATHIMNDGKFIKIIDIPKTTHMKISVICQPYTDISDINIDILSTVENTIKLNDGQTMSMQIPTMTIPLNEPTLEQYNALELWLYNVKNHTKHTIDMNYKDKPDEIIQYDLSQIEPKDVINDIKKYFNNKGGEAL